MAQMLLPFFPEDINYINRYIGFVKRDGYVWYFNAQMPMFHHPEEDINSFKMYVAQLYLSGNVKQTEIVKAFGVSSRAVKRWVKRYKEKGLGDFYKARGVRSTTILTPEKLSEIQDYLDTGMALSDISDLVKVKKDTISKAIQSGRLVKKKL